MKYFLGVEMAKSEQGIVLKHKYVIDLFDETGMLGCKSASTPIKVNHQLCSNGGGKINKERHQKLVGKLIYLSHTRVGRIYAVCLVSHICMSPEQNTWRQ